MDSSRRGRTAAFLLALIAAFSACAALAPGRARADAAQTTILDDDPLMLTHPAATLARVRALGVSTVRFDIPWAAIAPRAQSWTRPRFRATDPAAYGTAWGPYDAAIVAAQRAGVTIDLDLSPGAPRWATGRDQPHDQGYPHWQWEPDAADFGQFVRAIGERYSGNWDPVTNRLDPGNPADLPRVSFWSVWNEPNYGPSLAPQALPGHPGVEDSPRMYRALVDQAWSALTATGHTARRDTILVGELAPRSQLTEPGHFTTFNGMTPMVFLENLYCLGTDFRPLDGLAAGLRGCPTTAAASRRFVADNPALFQNAGIADHPYDEWFAPDQELDIPRLDGWALENTQDTSLATIGVLERGLDRITGAYGLHTQLAIWDTEYGYQTSPPHRIWSGDRRPWPSGSEAAYYDNWAEYLHYKNPRLKSFSQYLLQDAVAPTRANDYGAFPSGLIAYDGTAKPGLAAFRMPLYLPETTAASVRTSLEVWGAARPARLALSDLGTADRARTVTLEYRPTGSRQWTTFATAPLSATGYFDIQERFPVSGDLRIAWRPPADSLLSLTRAPLYSRSVSITVH